MAKEFIWDSMFANTQMTSMAFGMPDICLTPAPVPVPVPYPNIGLSSAAIPNCVNVLTVMMPTHNLMTIVPLSLGDQGGVAGGVMSGMFMGPVRPIMGSTKTFIGGLPATKMLSPTIHNMTNCPGVYLTPCQIKLMIMS